MSSLMVWVRDQLSRFLDRIEKQIFSPSTPLETIAVRYNSTQVFFGKTIHENFREKLDIFSVKLKIYLFIR